MKRQILRRAALLVALSICACGQQPIGNSVILRLTANEMADQCSRRMPVKPSGTWMPSPADIRELELAIPQAIAESGRGKDMTVDPLSGTVRQYVGTIRGDRKYIYGNFVSTVPPLPPEVKWRSKLVVVCDGGPDNFGVEYDVLAKSFTHLAFNGNI